MTNYIAMNIDLGTVAITAITAAMLAYVVVHVIFRWITVQPWEQVEAILADAKVAETRMAESIRADVEKVGVEVIAARLLDVQLSSELRKAAAGIELERRVGKVALERARGEIATLPALANAARMIDDNPRLESLRKLQVLETALAAPNRAIAVHIGEAGVCTFSECHPF
ncbi:MAG: hypothetical protein ABIV13_05560 [Fimbriimonadales bacterium]